MSKVSVNFVVLIANLYIAYNIIISFLGACHLNAFCMESVSKVFNMVFARGVASLLIRHSYTKQKQSGAIKKAMPSKVESILKLNILLLK